MGEDKSLFKHGQYYWIRLKKENMIMIGLFSYDPYGHWDIDICGSDCPVCLDDVDVLEQVQPRSIQK